MVGNLKKTRRGLIECLGFVKKNGSRLGISLPVFFFYFSFSFNSVAHKKLLSKAIKR